MKRDLKNFYTVEDFDIYEGDWTPLRLQECRAAMEIANAILREYVKENGRDVYLSTVSDNHKKKWVELGSEPAKPHTRAILLDEKEIEK